MQGLWFLPSLIFGAVQGFTTGSWQMLVFAAVSLSIWPLGKWIKNHRDFQLAGLAHFDGKDVWIGDHRLPRREIFWRKSWHSYLWEAFAANRSREAFPKVLETVRARGFTGEEPKSIWLGISNSAELSFKIEAEGPHLLIVGATGTGKSEMLRMMVAGWLNQIEQTELALIDFKGGATLARFARHPRVVALATDLNATNALKIAETFEAELMRRQKVLAEAQASSIEDFLEGGGRLCRLVIVIDELGELLRQHPKLSSVLEQVAARGRSLGLHLVATNQSMSGVSRGLLVNLRARIAIGDMDPIDFSQLGFRGRFQPRQSQPNWRQARLKNASGSEVEFEFPIGF
ncbi:MAG: FtsK/SpoIIIE domain-containing protein [Rhodoluna sp.]|nr:FtsK/SpoIIIE domain-containing protein [Rhodoluna sp.]